jgi:hypothetical protein
MLERLQAVREAPEARAQLERRGERLGGLPVDADHARAGPHDVQRAVADDRVDPAAGRAAGGGSKLAARVHTDTNASCSTSSASARSRTMRSATPSSRDASCS